MRNIYKSIKQAMFVVSDTPKPPKTTANLWRIWIVAAFVLFDLLLATEKMSFVASRGVALVGGIILTYRLVQNNEYLVSYLSKQHKNLLAYLYRGNIIWMIIGATINVSHQWEWYGIDSQYIAMQCLFLMFWFLTIPLTFVHSPLNWEIAIGTIFIGTLLGSQLLDWYIKSGGFDLKLFSILMVCGVLLSFIVSAMMSNKIIKDRVANNP